jgi:hypothetical protein
MPCPSRRPISHTPPPPPPPPSTPPQMGLKFPPEEGVGEAHVISSLRAPMGHMMLASVSRGRGGEGGVVAGGRDGNGGCSQQARPGWARTLQVCSGKAGPYLCISPSPLPPPQGDSYPLVIRLESLTEEGRAQGHTLEEVRGRAGPAAPPAVATARPGLVQASACPPFLPSTVHSPSVSAPKPRLRRPPPRSWRWAGRSRCGARPRRRTPSCGRTSTARGRWRC